MTPADLIAGLFIAFLIAVIVDVLAPRERRLQPWEAVVEESVKEWSK